MLAQYAGAIPVSACLSVRDFDRTTLISGGKFGKE